MPEYLSNAQVEALDDEGLTRYLAILRLWEQEWTLTERQQTAEDLSQQVDEILYGGAAGGGKSDWLLWHAYQLSQQYQNHRTLALRRTYPRLKETLILRSRERFDPAVAKYGIAEKKWTFPKTGSTITFGFCDTDDDVGQYLSTQYDLIIFDEATEFSEHQYMLIRSRNRANVQKRAQGIRPHTIAATNPGGEGHEFFKQRFVTSTDYGDNPISTQTLEVFGKKRDMTVAFVPAKVTDNPHIDPDYIFNLASQGEVVKRQYLLGDWDIFEGMYFSDWNRDVHVVRPFNIPQSWHRIRAVDYGFAAPYCCLWIAFDNDGNAYVYRERYGRGFTASAQGRQMAEASIMQDEHGREVPEQIHGTYADPSIWAQQGSGLPIVTQYRQEGIVCKKAMNKRIDGWSRVRDWLLGDGTADGGSKLRVFENCTNLIRTIPIQQFDKEKTEDLNTRLEDHAVDALRYGLATRPPRRPRAKPALPSGDIDRTLLTAARGARRAEHPVLGRA